MIIRFRSVLAATIVGLAGATAFVTFADQGPAPQREAHVELQTFQFNRVRAAMATTGAANTPGSAPAFAATTDPVEPGYIWRLTSDVPSAPSMFEQFEPDPVSIAFFAPIQPRPGAIAGE